ncbi:MAG: hypothetical protein ACEQSR_01895 [Candidatus Methylacidiphilales bacterium]
MHLTNFHFYSFKNYLYNKPVKGLRDYGVGYGFGFNGQEKDDEVSGAGNTMTAEFWEYDSRLCRRWNVDPLPKIHESPYAVFANNPIYIIDKNGADSTIYVNFSGSGLTTKQQNKAVKQLRKVYEESGVKSLKVVVTTEKFIDIQKFLNYSDQFIDFDDKGPIGVTTPVSDYQHTTLNIKKINFLSNINEDFGTRYIGNLMAHESGHGFLRRLYGGNLAPFSEDESNHKNKTENILNDGTTAYKRQLHAISGEGSTLILERFTKFDAASIQIYLSILSRNSSTTSSELLIKKMVSIMLTIEKKKNYLKTIFMALIVLLGLLYYFFLKKSIQPRCIIGSINGKTVFLNNSFDTIYKKFIVKIDFPELFYFTIMKDPNIYTIESPFHIFINENSEVDTCNYNPCNLYNKNINLSVNYDTLDLNFLNISNNCKKGDSLLEIVKNIIIKLEFRYDDNLKINPIGNGYEDFIIKNIINNKDINRKKIKEFENMIINKQGILFFSSNTFYFYEIKDGYIGATRRIRLRLI